MLYHLPLTSGFLCPFNLSASIPPLRPTAPLSKSYSLTIVALLPFHGFYTLLSGLELARSLKLCRHTVPHYSRGMQTRAGWQTRGLLSADAEFAKLLYSEFKAWRLYLSIFLRYFIAIQSMKQSSNNVQHISFIQILRDMFTPKQQADSDV
ncbi:uncharacterized protein BDR25DRAFT_348602 [Lindgomyces ingoldianus]|uniref:Uncharacterized protein n=1 Tax=Lindgomyces ingoldianus TaxID=673940 RepID=A0ACB6RGK7_9PLEO|nr:uncharacterized protein BDR25DRAFT_348602 [Lindgomyces ingoldianus]KAF2478351.1 hypothetical protein BDR25DRAFT_348602 [Lindgomyces ingoldianus]